MRLLAALVLLISPVSAAAQSCAPSTDADIQVFEAAKTAFLKTDYRAFAGLVDDYIPNIDAQFDQLFGPLDVFEPRGFSQCRTVLQRREAPSFAQEIVFFYPRGSNTPLALHMVGSEVDGVFRVLEFTYDTSVSAVLDKLH